MMCQARKDRQQRLFIAGARLVSRYGVEVSIAKIAKLARVEEAVLLNDFVSKEALFNALYMQIHSELCGELREYLIPSDSLHERARAIWNTYIAWGIAHPDWQRARHRLMVSDVLTDHTRNSEALLFPDVDVAEAASESDVFGEHPPEFGETLFIGLVETTITFAARDPVNAATYKQAGFNAYWRIFFALKGAV